MAPKLTLDSGPAYDETTPAQPFIGALLFGMSVTSMALTKSFCREFLATQRLLGDRRRSKVYDQRQRYDMQNGFFVWPMVLLMKVYVEEIKAWVRINGHSTCSNVAELPDGEFIPTVQMAEFRVKTLDEARMMFCLLDRARPRTMTQQIRCMLMGSEGYGELADSDLTLLHQGLNIYLTSDRYDLTLGERWNFLRKGGEFYTIAQRIRGLFAAHRRIGEMKFFRRPVVTAAMFAIFKKWPKLANAFFVSILSGKGMKGPIAKELRNRITDIIIVSNRGAKDKKELRSAEEAFKVIVNYFEWVRTKKAPAQDERQRIWEEPRPAGYEARKSRQVI